MKKKGLSVFGFLLISLLSSIAFTSCDKDTWCRVEVTVLDAKNNNMPSPGACVKIQYVKKNDADPQNAVVGTISDTGMCNENGVYLTRFAAPAIFTVTARINEPDTVNRNKYYYREGEKSVRLKEGEQVPVTVKVIGEKTLGRYDFEEI